MKKVLGWTLIIIGILAFIYLGIGLGIVGLVNIFTGSGSLFWNIALIAFRGIFALIVGGVLMFGGVFITTLDDK